MRTAVVTTVHGRAEHLRRQLCGLAAGTLRPDVHVVVAIADDEAATVVAAADSPALVVDFPSGPGPLPIAAARNTGARTALDLGAELLVFLDVDCIPSPDMIASYLSAATQYDHHGALLCGPVTYLPPPDSTGYPLNLEHLVDPHPARPVPAAGQIIDGSDYGLFWSLSFALTAPPWRQIGGFCTEYRGYGAEDTDFAQKASATDVPMRWVGGAHAFHQFHPVSDPPVEHLHDIVANATIFHRRWGWWPMQGWLDAFAALGLIRWDSDGSPAIMSSSGDAAT
jgi:GT2 family glycosyltransferase